MDTFVNPEQKITKSLYDIHGIQESDYLADNIPNLQAVQKELVTLLFGQQHDKEVSSVILIGHGINHDLKSLGLNTIEVTSGKRVRYIDTELYSAVSQKKEKLRDLAREHLNAEIQHGYHSSVIDARAAMAFFKLK